MKLEVNLDKREYLYHLRDHLSSFLYFGEERYTGIVLGSFFWVTYHSGYEWNRRITNEKNRAIGFARKGVFGTVVQFVRTKGYLDPVSMIFLWLGCFALSWVFLFLKFYIVDRGNAEAWGLPVSVVISTVVSIVIAVCTYFDNGMTERGCWGKINLMALLKHPEDPEHNLEELDE